jgi:hypothetical protein
MTEKLWHETMKLRWIDREAGPGHIRVLQQAWRNISSNELEFRDIELVESEDD